MDWDRFGGFVIRNRQPPRDIGMMLVTIAALTHCAFAFGIFESEPGIDLLRHQRPVVIVLAGKIERSLALERDLTSD